MEEGRTCSLLAITSTTGWLDWVHGELWLCPDGLLRRSKGWKGSLANVDDEGIKESVDYRNRPTSTFTDDEVAAIAQAGKRNLWLTWDQIATAKLGAGPLSYALHLQLTDGRKLSLRWARQDGPPDILKPALQSALGDRLQR